MFRRNDPIHDYLYGQTDDERAAPEPLILLSADEIETQERDGRDSKMLIEGLLPARGFCPLIGDSGLGKSPLLLQAAACIATGTPFLGLPVKRGRVLIVDHENQGHLVSTLRAVSRAIGKDYDHEVKPHLMFLPSAEASEVFRVFDAGHAFALTIVDAFRGFCGGAESDSKIVAPMITKMSTYDTCWLVCHHLRKEDRKAPPQPLEDLDTRVIQWLQEAAGSRAIVNQAFTRLAVIEPKGSDAALFIRGFVKGRGEVGPYHLARVFDPSDEEIPLGYELAQDWVLMKSAQRDLYRKVQGQVLSWRELKELLGDKPTRALLSAAKPLGLVSESGSRGRPDRRYHFKPVHETFETSCDRL